MEDSSKTPVGDGAEGKLTRSSDAELMGLSKQHSEMLGFLLNISSQKR